MRTNQNDFYKKLRLQELAGINRGTNNPAPSLANSTLLEFTRANDGTALAIVKENHSYYIKKSVNKGEDLGVQDFTYIGGVENKHKYSYGTLAEAKKNQNFYISSLNESLTKKMTPIGQKSSVITEGQALSTADSQIQASDFIANKTGKENAQAPINDTNAKSKADAGLSTPAAPSTQDSEISKSDFLANKSGKEKAQAPINDTNAKSKADSGLKTPAAPSTADSQINPKVKTTSKVEIAEAKNVATADSEIKKSDFIANKTGKESAQAPVNDTNAKSKADKGLKTPAAPSTADSQIKVKDLKNGQFDQGFKGGKKALTTADSEINAGKPKAANLKENELPKEDPTAAPAPAPSPAPAPAAPASPEASAAGGSDVDADLDAAASAVSDLDLGGEEPTAAPAGDGSEAGAQPAADATGDDANTTDDGGIKDIEKLVGKLGQKIRSANLTPEMTQGFLKSMLVSFKEKLPEVDSEKRKELGNMILNADQGVETGDGLEETLNCLNLGDDEREIEEAIDAHLAELASIGGEEAINAPQGGSFQSHMVSRGYDPSKPEQMSMMEMVSLMSGYMNENEGNLTENDFAALAEFMTPEISEQLAEFGIANFNESMAPFQSKISENKERLPYSDKPVVSMNENFGEEEEEDGSEEETPADDTTSTDDSSSENPFAKKDALGGDDSGETETEEEPIGGPDASSPIGDSKPTDDISIAPAADTIAIGAPASEISSTSAGKSVEVDLKNDTIKFSLSETENKLRNIVNAKIQEQLGLKKSNLHESKKSDFSKMLDKLIAEAIENKKLDLKNKVK